MKSGISKAILNVQFWSVFVIMLIKLGFGESERTIIIGKWLTVNERRYVMIEADRQTATTVVKSWKGALTERSR
jgi:hypothetical protein